jgi:hypothetical protein
MPSAVDCVACHATTGSVTHTGNGRFIMDVPQTYPFAGEVGGWKRGLHDFLLRVRPGPHQRAFLKPQWHRSAEFCGTCHRQSFGVPQNGFRLVRGADTYGEWQAGPFSGRSAQNAGNARSCQACHFPRNGTGHTAHSAPGANTALPALRGDTEHQAQIEQFVKQERITLDIFALRKEPTRSGQREKRAPEMWLAPLDAPQETVSLRSGDRVTLDIVVTNRGIGHSFPSGYADIRDAWLEVTLSDASGRVLLANGITATREEIPDDAHIYRTIPLDREGKPLRHHELDRMTTTAYRRVIPAGASDIARYVFTLPQPPSNRTFRIHARLRYRPLRPEFARWVLGEKSPALPMTTLAETTVEIEGERRKAKGESEGKGEPTPNTKNQKPKTKNQSPTPEQMALRFMNYGNGLIAPAGLPDRAAALRAFRQAQILAPKRPGPYIGMGRAYLTEPDFLAARVQFEKALALAPNHPAASHALGFVLGKQGEYERALHILAPLAKRFPQDVALHFDLGVTYFRLGRYAEASEAFRCALTTDPDYAPAHFQLKRCYQHLRRVPEARREEAIGKYLAEDEETPRLRETYLRNHPAERPATLPIPRHNLRSR